MKFTKKLFLLAFVFCLSAKGQSDFEKSKEVIVMRAIAHDILRHAGDSTSRVLPVKTAGNNQYQLRFESWFTFDPDSLVAIIHRHISENGLSQEYIVNVIECLDQEVIFGYAKSETEQNELVPCLTRDQPENCYVINIIFAENKFFGFERGAFFAGLGVLTLLLILAVFAFFSKNKKRLNGSNEKPTQIGRYEFFFEGQYLIFDQNKIELTNKEARLLSILVATPNETIERNQLQKVWEDEGVIVGRSLDVFISKLRKKLKGDAKVSITNVHGKGYKLEVGEA